MKKTFQEQLLQLGLVDKKKAGQVKKEQHQNKKQNAKAGKNVVVVDENALLAQQIEEKKKARARKLNLQREAKLQKRAEDAQVKQLVEQNRLDKDDRGIAYRFNVSGKIQRIFVATAIADQLSDGRLGIVGIDGRYEVVPRATIEKIKSISDRVFINIVAASSSAEKDPDDPYAGYEVPDDLMW
jgi:uncharacterized protein YaiL (DUF2058 family)